MLRSCIISIVLIALCYKAMAQNCGRSLSCGECISTAGCAWCADLNMNLTIRCFSAATINSTCAVIENPSGSAGIPTPSAPTNPINVRDITMNLRVGEPQEFTVGVTAVRNLPLDLYILMDLSSSMGQVLDSVQSISGDIIDSIRDITNNVQVAFGSFSDKDLLPFTNGRGGVSEERTYAFRHRFDFSTNTTAFSNAINTARVTRNVDAAENTLEALAQVIVCDEMLGWRSRDTTQVARLILVLTDQGFHYAGEGKFAGILTPFPGDCQLSRTISDNELEFTQFGVVDYPSVGQLVDIIEANDVNVIFTVPTSLLETYNTLVSFTNGRATTSTLTVTGSAPEILSTIETEYRALLRDITLRSTDTSGQISVQITPSCPDGSNVTDNGIGCSGVQLEQQATFTVSLTLNSCDGLDGGQTKTLTMDAGAFGTFSVQVNGVCNCGCEINQVPFSVRCNERGNFSCGVCECLEGYCGPMCELMVDSGGDICPVGGLAFNNAVCSNRGVCDCQCRCDEGTFGTACECDETSSECKLNEDDLVCSGRGTCCNRECSCGNSEAGFPYYGVDGAQFCQCEPVEEVCIYEGRLCNDQGNCICEGCMCNRDWKGSFCEIPVEIECNNEIDEVCIPECHPVGGDAGGSPMVCTTPSCNRNRPTIIADLPENPTDSQLEDIANDILGSTITTETLSCTSQFIPNCEYTYYLLTNGTNVAIVVDRQIMCVALGPAIPSYAIALIALGVVIILVILIIIIIKIIFVILDYIEVKRWQRETQGADFSKNQNPLYQSPETKYTNVMYGKAL